MKEEVTEFERLYHLDVNSKTEKKKTGNTELTYLSWAWAWAEFVKVYPEARYEIVKNNNSIPYFADESGAMVYTKVTAGEITHEMWLPVMDGANNAMKSKPYTYQVKEYVWDNSKRKNVPTGNMVDKKVEAYTMFDINKTVMRCLVKNLAMFGLGLYIYAGEDLPESEESPQQQQKAPPPSKATDDDRKQLWNAFKARCGSIDPMLILEQDGIDMSDKAKVYAIVRQYQSLSDEAFEGVLDNFR
ncbi:MAG TPA: DUF1071 domain-containing protein [Methanosarcina sp.]|nr:DUF1071 domain-containing protein [Methanosarcina sp.]